MNSATCCDILRSLVTSRGLQQQNKPTCVWSTGLPDSGFYPEISGFFEADGIFLGNFFLAKNLGKNLRNSQEKFT